MIEPILRAPLNVEWEITKACNLRCTHCYTSAGKREPGELTKDEALRIIDHLNKVGISDVTISGGEPLLRKDLEDIASDLKKREIPFVICTNGILLSMERQLSLKEAGATTFSLSLNGTTPQTHNYVQGEDTFKTVLERISQLKENGLYVLALYTLMKINVKEALEIPSFLDDIGLDSLCIYPFYPAGRGADHISEFKVGGEELHTVIQELLKDRRVFLGGCMRGTFHLEGPPCARLMCVITSEGKLRPCNFLPFHTEETLLRKDVYTLWKLPVFEKVRTWHSHVKRKCSECEYDKTCGGKCLAFHIPLLSEEETTYLL